MKKKPFGALAAIPVVLIVLLLAGGAFVSVAENEYAVITRFSRIVRVIEKPGLNFKIPFAENARMIPKSVQIYDIQPSDVITSDKKSMIADDYILWRVVDPMKFARTLSASTSVGQDRVGVAVYNATKNIISSMSQDDVIASRGEKLTTMITEDAQDDVTNYGIEIVKAEIKRLDLPDDNKEAVYERMISERENIAAAYEAEGKANAQKIRNETDRKVAVMQANAEKGAAVTEAEGEAEYMRTLQEAYNTPEKAEFYNYIRSLDALKASLKGDDKTLILDKDSEIAKILYGNGLN